MTPEVYAAIIQRLSLQLVTGLNGQFTTQADAIIKHIEQMYGVAVEMRQAIKNAEKSAEAEKVN